MANNLVGTKDLQVNAVTQIGFASRDGTDFTTSSATYVDVTSMSVAMTTAGGDLLVLVDLGLFYNDTLGDNAIACLNLDGVDSDPQGMAYWRNANGTNVNINSLPIMHRFTGVAAGAHTVKLRAKQSVGGTVHLGASVVGSQMIVLEVKR